MLCINENKLFLDMEGRERERFFEESLKRLQSASAGGFEKLRNRCEIELFNSECDS